MRKTDEGRTFRPIKRTSQVVFGERHHLRCVLESIMSFSSMSERTAREKLSLEQLIDARTAELNRIHANFDQNLEVARNPKTAADELSELFQKTSADDYLLLRIIAEHPNTPSSVLALLAQHSYDAVKENVARHANSDARTLEKLADDPTRPLWFLVACNASAPEALQQELKKRMWQTPEKK